MQQQLFPQEIIEINNADAADIILLNKFGKRVFVFDSSAADEKYFKQAIANYINGDKEYDYNPFHQICWDMIYERNENGKYCKYLYFNERNQRLYLDRTFKKWAELVFKLLNEQLAN